jgi:hypothetical protein
MHARTKSEQIEILNQEINTLLSLISTKDSVIKRLEDQLEKAEIKIKSLYAENDVLTHTPEISADTTAAFERGRQDGVRSLSHKATSDMLSLGNDMYDAINDIIRKYTRDLTVASFLGTVEEAQVVSDLPDTDFAQDMLNTIQRAISMAPLAQHQ